MSYLDNSGQDASPSFLQALARSLGIGGSQPPQPPNRAALASALSGQPLPPPGTHYAQLPGPPLLLQDTGDAVTAGRPAPLAPPTAVPAAASVPVPLSTMRGALSDIPGAVQAASGGQPASSAIAAPPSAAKAVVVPGYEAKGPLTRAQVSAAPDDDKTMPAEEDWDQAAAKLAGAPAGTQVAQATPPAQAPMSAYEQTLKARFDQQEQLIRTTTNPEVAKMAIAEANKINDELSVFRKPGTRTLSDAELTPSERAAGGEWQQSATGERSQVGGTAGDTTRAPNAEESARLQAAGQNAKNYQVKDGALERIPGTEPKAEGRSFGIIGEDQFGNKQYGFTDKTTGEVIPYRPPIAPVDGDTATLHGKEFIDTLNPKIAGQVTAIVEGRAPYPTGMLLKTPYGQQLAAMVTQADPTFESGNSAARVATRKEFESGGPNSVAGTITSGNAAIKHLGELSDDAEALGNRSIPIWNAAANAYETQTGDKRVTNFNNTIGRFGEEATKFYRGIGGSEADVQRDIANLSPNMSPEQLRGAIQKQANLMRDKIVAYQDRWHKAMGPMVPDFPIVDPSTQNVLGKLDTRAGNTPVVQGSEPFSSVRSAPASLPLNVPPPGFTKGGYRFKGGDPSQQNNWEKVQ